MNALMNISVICENKIMMYYEYKMLDINIYIIPEHIFMSIASSSLLGSLFLPRIYLT